MALTVQLSAELEARLTAEAEARGISVEAYAACLLEQAARAGEQPNDANETRRQAVRDMLAFRQKYHLTLGPGLRIKDLIHEGHKY